MQDVRLWAQRAAALDTMAVAGRAFAAAGLSAVALKGVWLLAEVLPSGRLRPLTDVDLLVSHLTFEQAIDALRRVGFVVQGGDARQTVLSHPSLLLPVDLHQELFAAHTFSLPAMQVLERSRTSDFEGVRFPDPLDGFAHVVGHFANDRAVAISLGKGNDLQLIADRFALDPARVAEHLECAGLGRASRYVLGTLAAQPTAHRGDDFFPAVLAGLRTDALGSGIATFARWAVSHVGGHRVAGAAITSLLQPSLAQAARSGLERMRARRGWKEQ